jgi:hypothetical protein
MLLGPEGTSSPLSHLRVVGVLVSSAPGASLALIPVLCSASAGWGCWWVVIWVCGLVGVCELDSGCEHLVVLLLPDRLRSEFLPAGMRVCCG